MRALRAMGAVPALALLAGCGNPAGEERVCAAEVIPSLRVEVVDAATGASLVPGAGGSWVTNGRAGELENPGSISRHLIAYGPAGRYSLFVQHPGYAVWGRDGLRVERGSCGPRTLSVRAELVRGGGGANAGAMPPGR